MILPPPPPIIHSDTIIYLCSALWFDFFSPEGRVQSEDGIYPRFSSSLADPRCRPAPGLNGLQDRLLLLPPGWGASTRSAFNRLPIPKRIFCCSCLRDFFFLQGNFKVARISAFFCFLLLPWYFGTIQQFFQVRNCAWAFFYVLLNSSSADACETPLTCEGLSTINLPN